MKKKPLVLLLCALILAGCAQPQPEEPVITESLVWEETPPLSHGVLEYEKLTSQPWYCGRLEYSGRCSWAETEQGYYHFQPGEKTIYYADKANLSNWVPVCSKPACQHTMNVLGCDARLGGNTFVLRNGRIYFTSVISQLYGKIPEKGDTVAIFSRAFDGTDLKLEYQIEATLSQGGAVLSDMLTASCWIFNICQMNPDGTHTCTSYCTTAQGTTILAEMVTEDRTALVVHQTAYNLGGDALHWNDLLSVVRGDPFDIYYRFRNGAPEGVDFEPYQDVGKYLHEDTLRLYRQNDGYYDLDLVSGEETFLAPAQLEDAQCAILLPNCILEFTQDRIRLFDGESWREVKIPEELKEETLRVEALASDRILLAKRTYVGEVGDMHLYQILLDQDTPELEYCGKVY